MQATVPEANVPTDGEKRVFAAGAYGAELVDLAAPILADVDRIVTSVQIADGAQAIAAQPDLPRNVTATLTDADDSVSADVLIEGQDMGGHYVSELMQIRLGVGKAFVGTKIFARVTAITVSNTSGSAVGDNLVVGVGNVIGLPKPIATTTAVKLVYFNGAITTPDAVAVGQSSSGVDCNGATYDGSKVLRVLYRPGE